MLQAQPDLTQSEVALQLGISTSCLYYPIRALIDKGWFKIHNFSESKSKFGYVYLITPAGIKEKALLAHRFLKIKLSEYEEMRSEIESLLSDVLLQSNKALVLRKI